MIMILTSGFGLMINDQSYFYLEGSKKNKKYKSGWCSILNKIRNIMKSNKGFTLIELIVVIAVLAILVLLGLPRLLGYTEKAELTRIQHDTKVMENEIETILVEDDIDEWENNDKVFGPLIMEGKLYEKEGIAADVDATHLSNDNGSFALTRYFSQMNNSSDDSELGVGGNLHSIDELPEDFSVEKTYKIVPEEYKNKINTKLNGTFYANNEGKVYYEHGKALIGDGSESLANCPLPAPDYEFEHETGTITKWHGTETHLTIPEEFLVDGKCYPVRIIGTGAFMNGNFKRVVIPNSVIRIEDGAFQDGELTEVTIPHSVTRVGNNAFANNNFGTGGRSIIILNSPGGISLGTNAFGGSQVHYRTPTPADAGFIFHAGSQTIISRMSNSVSGAGMGGSLIIPDKVQVNNVEYEVTSIKEGAFQGAGLIDVVLPSGLERIEDYAFAGNRLEKVIIPDKVYYIGNYAFAFNQETHTTTGQIRPTIQSIMIKNVERISNVVQGDINTDIPGVELKDYVWVTEADNFNFEEFDYYNPVDEDNSAGEDNSDNEIVKEPNGLRSPNANEIVVTDAQGLHDIRNDLDGEYILMADIDLGLYDWQPIGHDFSNEFSGKFDGNGFKINNLTINKSQFSFDTGLFGRTDGAEILNVAIENADVVAGSQTGTLVGYAQNNTIIKNSYATGVLGGNRHAAGLIGNLIGGSEIIDSYSTVEVYYGHDLWHGGLSSATQSNRIRNSFWDTDVSNVSSHSDYTLNSGAVGLTTEQMKQADTYSAWDADVWNIVNGKYPTLKNSH